MESLFCKSASERRMVALNPASASVIDRFIPSPIPLNASVSFYRAFACCSWFSVLSWYRTAISRPVIAKNTANQAALLQFDSGGQIVTTTAKQARQAMYIPTGGLATEHK